MSDYTMFRGDTFILAIQVTKNGAAVDITGGKLWFTLKKQYTDPDQLAFAQLSSPGGGIVITAPRAGKATATMPATATLGFPDGPVVCVYDVQLLDAVGTVVTVDIGTITVMPDVTRTTTAVSPPPPIPPSLSPNGVYTVSNEAALTTVDDTAIGFGLALEAGTQTPWVLDKTSTLPVTAGLVQRTGSAIGRWIAFVWAFLWSQFQATWYIDPQNVTGLASDRNTGLTAITPLLTDGELLRRVGRWKSLDFGVNIWFLSRRNASDPACIFPSATTTQNGYVYAHGVPLGTGSTVLKTGTLSNWNPRWTATKAIVSSTNAAPISMQVTAHGLATGDSVQVDGHLVNTEANRRAWIVTRTDADNFTLDGSTGNGVGGATGTVFRQDGNQVTDSVGASFGAYVTGQLLMLTSGAGSGACTPIVNTATGGIAYVGEFIANPNGTTARTVVTPTGNETYAVVQPTDLFTIVCDVSGSTVNATGRNLILDSIGWCNRTSSSAMIARQSVIDSTDLLEINCVAGEGVVRGISRWTTNCILLGNEIDDCVEHFVNGGATMASANNAFPERFPQPGLLVYFALNHVFEGDCIVFVEEGVQCWITDAGLNCPAFAPFAVLPGGRLFIDGHASLWGKTGAGFVSLAPFAWCLYQPGFIMRARSSDDTDVYGNGSDSAARNPNDTPLKMTWPNIVAPYTGKNGAIQKKSATITRAMLTDAVNGETQTLTIGSPFASDAVLVGFRVTVNELFGGGGVAIAILFVGATTGIASFGYSNVNVLSGPLGVRPPDENYSTGAIPMVAPAGTSVTASFAPDGGHSLAQLTTGSVTIDVYYFEALTDTTGFGGSITDWESQFGIVLDNVDG